MPAYLEKLLSLALDLLVSVCAADVAKRLASADERAAARNMRRPSMST